LASFCILLACNYFIVSTKGTANGARKQQKKTGSEEGGGRQCIGKRIQKRQAAVSQERWKNGRPAGAGAGDVPGGLTIAIKLIAAGAGFIWAGGQKASENDGFQPDLTPKSGSHDSTGLARVHGFTREGETP
jgi:hypothetical protein